jgi:hypothetical protein
VGPGECARSGAGREPRTCGRFPAVGPFKAALAADGIPFTAFGADDLEAEVSRLIALGVRFIQQPLDLGPVTTAVLEDGFGNLLQLQQAKAMPAAAPGG